MTSRQKLICHQMLTALDNASPWLVEKPLLLDTVNLVIRPRVLDSEFKETLRLMEARALIRIVTVDDETKIKITDEGKAALLE